MNTSKTSNISNTETIKVHDNSRNYDFIGVTLISVTYVVRSKEIKIIFHKLYFLAYSEFIHKHHHLYYFDEINTKIWLHITCFL